MAGGGGKGGTQTTTVELPPEIEEAAISNLRVADEVAAMGFTPYSGPTLAGLTPGMEQSMMGVNDAARAFGMPNTNTGGMTQQEAMTAMTGMPAPQQFAGGMSGYSPMGMYEEALSKIPPAQRAMIESFVMNPVTGAIPTNPAVPAPQFRYGEGIGQRPAYGSGLSASGPSLYEQMYGLHKQQQDAGGGYDNQGDGGANTGWGGNDGFAAGGYGNLY